MLSLYKTLVRPDVEYCSSAWSPLYKYDEELIEKIPHRFTKMIKNMESKSYYDRLRYLGLWTLEERKNRHDLIELFKIFEGLSRVRIDDLIMFDENTKGTRGHCMKLRKTQCTGDITRHFFRIRWSIDGTCWISGQSMHLA